VTYQTDGPLKELKIYASARAIGDLIHQVNAGTISYNVPYQRGAVWNSGQRIMLIKSLLCGTPVPALILNSRPSSMWFGKNGEELPVYAVIDGKQRLMTLQMFLSGRLLVPLSWWPHDQLTREPGGSVITEDGTYVNYRGITRPAQRFFENTAVPVAEARLKSVEEEAEVYLRVNGAGTPQSDADMERARRYASGKSG